MVVRERLLCVDNLGGEERASIPSAGNEGDTEHTDRSATVLTPHYQDMGQETQTQPLVPSHGWHQKDEDAHCCHCSP